MSAKLVCLVFHHIFIFIDRVMNTCNCSFVVNIGVYFVKMHMSSCNFDILFSANITESCKLFFFNITAQNVTVCSLYEI